MTKKEKMGEFIGWAGLFLLQGSSLPVTYDILANGNKDLPPFILIFMVWLGLIAYDIRSFIRKDWLYITSNTIGVILQGLLLLLILKG